MIKLQVCHPVTMRYHQPPMKTGQLIMRKLLIYLVLSASGLTLTACSISIDRIPGMYRIDVQQGSVITQDMLAKLKPGMSKRRVKFILGTPPIADTFHNNRWDYIYSYQRRGGTRQQRRVTAIFENDKLVRIEGDVTPGSDRSNLGKSGQDSVEVPAGKQKKKGFFRRMMGVIGLGDDDE